MPARNDSKDLVRAVGGLLLAVGALVLMIRKSSHHEWGDFALLVVVLVPTLLLYTLTLADSSRDRLVDSRAPSQSVLLVSAVLLTPIVLFQFLDWAGARAGTLNSAAVFAITAAIAGYTARRTRVSYAALLCGLSTLVCWLLLWDKVLGHPSADTFRWLLVAGGALLLVASVGLARAGAMGAREIATTGAIAAVAAGVLGVVVGAFVGTFRGISSIESTSTSAASSLAPASTVHHQTGLAGNPLFAGHVSGLQHPGWDVYLLVVSATLVWIASRTRSRGIGYAGGFGLVAFVLSAGAQITRLESGHLPNGHTSGWPLVLLIVGAAGLILSVLQRQRG